MFEGEEGEKMMEVMLPAQVDMQYGPILSELGLSEERRSALREVLLEHARKGAAIGMAMMRGEKKLEDIEVPGDEDLMAAVGEVLDPEELAQFEQYQEELPERMMRQQFDMQMGMMAGDLPEEVRAVAVDVLVENLLAAQPDQKLGAPDFEAMRAAFDDTLVVLERELEPEHLERGARRDSTAARGYRYGRTDVRGWGTRRCKPLRRAPRPRESAGLISAVARPRSRAAVSPLSWHVLPQQAAAA